MGPSGTSSRTTLGDTDEGATTTEQSEITAILGTPEQRVEWEAEVRSSYDGMVRVVITPELVRQRAERQPR